MIFDPIINWLQQSPQIQCMLAGGLAGIIRTLQGYLDSGEPFHFGKFTSTVIRAALYGSLAAQAQQHPIAAFFEVYTAETITHKSYKEVSGRYEFRWGSNESKKSSNS